MDDNDFAFGGPRDLWTQRQETARASKALRQRVNDHIDSLPSGHEFGVRDIPEANQETSMHLYNLARKRDRIERVQGAGGGKKVVYRKR